MLKGFEVDPDIRRARTIPSAIYTLSPDGRTAVFHAWDISPEAADHQRRLFLRRLDRDELVEVQRSTGVTYQTMSPDGQWLAFTVLASELSSRFELVKVPLDGSTPPVKIADFPAADYRQLAWTSTDRIYSIMISGDGLISWPAGGGAPGKSVPIQSERSLGQQHLWNAGDRAGQCGRHGGLRPQHPGVS